MIPFDMLPIPQHTRRQPRPKVSARLRWVLPLVVSLAGFPAVLSASQLDDHIESFEQASNQQEDDVLRILRSGLDENRSARAFAATKAWLSTHPDASAKLSLHAAQVAERAGEWPAAAGHYRKLLANPSVDKSMAATAVPAVYRLLINHLNAPETAYLMMRKDGTRLRQYGDARRFDSWFLHQAAKRKDLIALSQWLTAVHNNNEPLEPFDDSLEFLLREIETYSYNDEALFTSLEKLVAAKRTSPQTKARIDWVKTILPYQKEAATLIGDRKKIPEAILQAPVEVAKELVALMPYHGSLTVARGWMHYNHGDSPTFARFVNPLREQKADPILKALPKLTTDQALEILNLSVPYARNRSVAQYLFSPSELRSLAKTMPAFFNSLKAPDVPLIDDTLTVEEAERLAPKLARNPHPDAAVIRLLATGKTNYQEVVDLMMKNGEAWRFADIKSATKPIWESSWIERSGKQSDLFKKYENFDGQYQKLAKHVSSSANNKERLAAFDNLLKDLTSPSPKISGGLELWDQLFKQAPDADTVRMLDTLVSQFNEEVEFLLRRALEHASFGKSGRMPWKPEVHWSHFNHKAKTLESAGELIAKLGKILEKHATNGHINTTLFGMWLHSVDTSENENVKLMRSIADSEAYAQLDKSYRQVAADDKLFGSDALSPKISPHHSAFISRELLALGENATPAQVERALDQAIDRASKARHPVAIIGLEPVAQLPEWSDKTQQQILSLFNENAPLGEYPNRQGYEPLVIRLAGDFNKADKIASIEPHIPGLWHAAAATDNGRYHRAAQALTECITTALEANQPSVALSLARCAQKSRTGSLIANTNHREPRKMWDDIRIAAGQAATAVGAVEIPVDESDPTYPIYKAYSEFILGNEESAWTLYHKHAEKLPEVLASLSPEFGLWLLERNISENESERAEALVRELTIWSRQAEGTFNAVQEASLRIAYADLAFRKGALPTARAWYRKVADAAEYQGTAIQLEAALGSIRVDRAAKNFSAALTELDKLMRLPDPEFRVKIHFARAEVLMEQENYAEALEELEAVLRTEPKHADALILRGKIHFQMRKLVEASEIELGPSREDTVLVPGEVLKINLRDPSLQVSGLGADIEVEVRTASGDVERLLLYQLGDSKDKFRAEITTALGATRKGDKVLQVLGKDEISYGYSKRFRDRMEDLPDDPETTISVASDAQLALSAGAFPPRKGERKLNIEELGLTTAQAALGTGTVRPGNPIYLRVIDADRSITSGVDEVHLDLVTSSGDSIRKLTLTETGPFTGEFETTVMTAPAQALAFASESAPGRDPNMAISSNEYPGWLAEVGNPEKTRIFGVDINDNAAIHRMVVETGTDTASLTNFVIQTSLNGKDWESRARFPREPAPWDGRPQITSMPTYRGGIPVSTPEDHQLPDDWVEKLELGSIRDSVGYGSTHVTNFTPKDKDLDSTGHSNHTGLFRFRAMFHQPERAIRTFRLDGLPATNKNDEPITIFLINGESAEAESEDGPLTIKRELEPGLHTIEVWTHMIRSEYLKLNPQILCDTAGETELSPCPDAMFNPSTFPDGLKVNLPQPAEMTQEGTKFNVQFGDQTQARMIRLVINGFAGVAPTITKVTLHDRRGNVLLPVTQDYQNLRNNEQLEVLPGDRISARYEDPVSASPKRNRHEKSLRVAFNDGSISASFLDYELDKNGERVLVLEPIRRFRMDDAIAIVIQDADLDTSRERDIIECTVHTASGNTTTLKVVETEEHSGQFIGRVFPIEGEPSRASEIRIQPGDTLTASYRDVENLNPGIPVDRSVTIGHAKYTTPRVEAYTARTEALPAPEAPAKEDQKEKKQKRRSAGPEVVTPRFELIYEHVPAEQASQSTHAAKIGSNIRFDVIAPHLALAPSSKINAYVQTDAARKAATANGKEFDLTVPGTLKISGNLRGAGFEPPKGYQLAKPPKAPTQSPPLEEGRFSFSVPLLLGDPPIRSFATKSAEDLPTSSIPKGLAVKAGDLVHIAYAWQDEDNNVQWRQLSFTVDSNAILDVMEGGYRDPLYQAFVGEKVYLRLIAPGLDQSPGLDTTEVSLKGSSGAATKYQLTETDPHSGIFKAVFTISYADTTIPAELPPVALNGFPVRYGENITVAFEDQQHQVLVKKGANGRIEPFSKRFTGGEMAVRTSFTLAECYFELAKKHRQLEQESLARREIGHARKLLAEALATHRDDDMKAHAEYLLGNLAQEFADLAKNEESKLPMYQDALARFIKIPADYPESEFAPKAQFKTALVYEKMGEIDNSVEEYVKLAYKYPKNELIPMVMSRLGGYFQKKGQAYKDQADLIREKTDDASVAEVLRLDQLSYPQFINAAMVFAKLQERFPDDPLAGLAGLRAAQNMMRAHQYARAIGQFELVIDNELYDDSDIRAQAIYWSGLCHERGGASLTEAYQLYRRVTFDFPDSKWAKYARGRLADSAFSEIIRKEKKEREKMIRALKSNME